MVAPISSTNICNLALSYLSQAPISDISEPETSTEEECARWYDTTRRDLLRRGSWNFAKKRVVLTPNDTTPAFTYDTAYNLPADFLRLLRIEDQDDTVLVDFLDVNSPRFYVVEDNQILINTEFFVFTGENLNLVYIRDFENVLKMDASFIKLFAIELALNMSYRFISDNASIQRILTLKETIEKDCRAINGQENPPFVRRRSRLLNSRYRGYREETSFGRLSFGGY